MLAAVVGCRLGYWRFSVGRRELLLNSCVQLVDEVRQWKLDGGCDSEEVGHDLRPLFVSTRTGKVELWPLFAGHKLYLVRIHPARGISW